MNEITSSRVNEWMRLSLVERMNEITSSRVNEWMNEWMNEITSSRVNEWDYL